MKWQSLGVGRYYTAPWKSAHSRAFNAACKVFGACARPADRYIERMNTPTRIPFRSRGVERVVRGQPTSDGAG
ncbi:MAG: hypothetical protein ACXWIZ_07530, partial [Caldimonas sp.]